MPKKLKRPATTRQEKFFALLCKGKAATQAAIEAGYSGKNPRQSAYQAMKGLRSRTEFALDEAGLTPEGLIHKYLLPALKANKTEWAKFEGEFTDHKTLVAWDTRLAAIKLAAEIGGYLAPKEFTGKDGEALFPDVIDTSGLRSRKPAHGNAAHS